MTDSRITVAVGEVLAAKELLADATRSIEDLLEEDPAFGGTVLKGLQSASYGLFLSGCNAANALSALRTADALENREVA
jgi:hypothetical protein